MCNSYAPLGKSVKINVRDPFRHRGRQSLRRLDPPHGIPTRTGHGLRDAARQRCRSDAVLARRAETAWRRRDHSDPVAHADPVAARPHRSALGSAAEAAAPERRQEGASVDRRRTIVGAAHAAGTTAVHALGASATRARLEGIASGTGFAATAEAARPKATFACRTVIAAGRCDGPADAPAPGSPAANIESPGPTARSRATVALNLATICGRRSRVLHR